MEVNDKRKIRISDLIVKCHYNGYITSNNTMKINSL